jgi:hypothetical protein
MCFYAIVYQSLVTHNRPHVIELIWNTLKDYYIPLISSNNQIILKLGQIVVWSLLNLIKRSELPNTLTLSLHNFCC